MTPLATTAVQEDAAVWPPREWSEEEVELERLRLELQNNSADVRVILRMGDLHLRLEEYDRALSLYERVAELYASEGRLIKSVAVFKQIHSIIEKRAPHVAERFAYTQARLAELFEELMLYDDALAIWKSIAVRHIENEREAEACVVLERVIRLAPNSITARLMLATLHARAGETQNAVRLLEHVVTLSLSAGRQNDAIRALRRLLKIHESVDQARLLAELLLDRGNKEDALEALKHLLVCYRDNPKSLPTLRFLVRAFDRVGQPEKANAVLKASARVVFESGARETFNRIVNALLERAPNDPEVAELDAMHEPVLLKSTSR